jgi:hypothetical protein
MRCMEWGKVVCRLGIDRGGEAGDMSVKNF